MDVTTIPSQRVLGNASVLARRRRPRSGGPEPHSGRTFRRLGPVALCVAIGVLSTSLPAEAVGQTVRGRVVLEADGSPVEGMFIALVDAATAERRAGALTDASGLFIIQPPPGVYQLRGDRIGLRTVASGPHTLGVDSNPFLELVTAPQAIALEGLDVEGEKRCRLDPAVGTATARVWEEVRKALNVVAWSSEAGLYQYNFSRFERHLDAKGRRVESESQRSFSGWSKNPYVSVSPEQLAETGFATGRAGSRIFFAPDAHVLLSDEFLAGHCFRLEREETHGVARLGLAFEPVERGPGVDIEGVLWLDERTGLLDRVDFSYLNFDPDVRSRMVGGTVEFRRLDSGAWIVPSWVIRLPILGRRDQGTLGVEHVLVGIREEGGEVTRMIDGTILQEAESDQDRARIDGTVFDSTTGGPLSGARVYVSGTSYGAVTDDTGAFEITGVRPGEYAIGVFHGRLDSLGVRAPTQQVVMGPGTTTRVQLVVPTLRSVLATNLCPPVQRSDTTVVLLGVVRDPVTGASIPDATVRLTAKSFGYKERGGRGRVSRHRIWLEVRSNADGRYAFCQVPPDQRLELETSVEGRPLALDSIPEGLSHEEVHLRDIHVRSSEPKASAGASAVQPGRLTGLTRARPPLGPHRFGSDLRRPDSDPRRAHSGVRRPDSVP